MGNASKQKWLHALGLTPASDMTPEQLQQVPEGSAVSPYGAGSSSGKGKKRGADGAPGGDEEDEGDLGAQTWRWQQHGKRPNAPIAKPSQGALQHAVGR